MTGALTLAADAIKLAREIAEAINQKNLTEALNKAAETERLCQGFDAVAILTACTMPKVKIPTDWCVRFEARWEPEKQIEPKNICICTDDLWPGLIAAIDAMTSKPDWVEPTGTVMPEDCDKPLKAPELCD